MTSAILIKIVTKISLKGSSAVKKRLIYLNSGGRSWKLRKTYFMGKLIIHTLVKLPTYKLKKILKFFPKSETGSRFCQKAGESLKNRKYQNILYQNPTPPGRPRTP